MHNIYLFEIAVCQTNWNPTYRVSHKPTRENPSIWTSEEKKALLRLEYRQVDRKKKKKEDRGQMLFKHIRSPLSLLRIHVKCKTK